MKIQFSVILICVLNCSTAFAEDYNIAGTVITVPAPEGFQPVTPDMGLAYRVVKYLRDSANYLKAYYISDADASIAKTGQRPSFQRTCTFKVNKQLEAPLLNKKDFNDFKAFVKKQNKDSIESIQSKLHPNASDTGDAFSEEFDVNVALKISNSVELEIHYETENAIANTKYLTYETSKDRGAPKRSVDVTTATIVNVAGKVIFLYCKSSQNDLEWTRDTAKAWTEKILAGNSPPPADSSE
jgi:hypothetical protein